MWPGYHLVEIEIDLVSWSRKTRCSCVIRCFGSELPICKVPSLVPCGNLVSVTVVRFGRAKDTFSGIYGWLDSQPSIATSRMIFGGYLEF